jgi:hypothetical protein
MELFAKKNKFGKSICMLISLRQFLKRNIIKKGRGNGPMKP